MLISRQLCAALLISFFWHLFWISSVSIVNLAARLRPRQYSSVNFLGSILRNELTQGDAEKELIELPAEADIYTGSYFKTGAHTFLQLQKKTLNPDAFIDLDLSREKMSFLNNSGTLAQGQRAQRQVIFQPAFTEYPEWEQHQLRGNYAVFEVCISGDGLVEQVINVKTCGNPEIDVLLTRYLRRWRFAPAVSQKEQWQTVKINLNFENVEIYESADTRANLHNERSEFE